MRITPLSLPDVLRIDPVMHHDARGYFVETYIQSAFDAAVGRPVPFLQDNQSHSRRHVLRGLHYQTLQSQGKLVRVTEGEIFDVAVDMREGSPTFGQWTSEILSSENQRQLWLPEGFAHGFLVLSDYANVVYKTTVPYLPAHQHCVRWDDPALAIPWPAAGEPILSDKDRQGLALAQAPRVVLG
ncbi:dTDP-4-dehydrorhamnose 3,5-epimerase [Achromobacter sp. UBA4530]|uniref:dTDP-4-dehydrorhamnose 3,5-epimerase n=1 Tax=Achromobacter sp. UBA4530 TaxID=1945912 RepID=UPI002580A7C3|nr:dTDP-4-dehydrorhamnose 3,5-epimerase [Achromobacter sp. UBA4530]